MAKAHNQKRNAPQKRAASTPYASVSISKLLTQALFAHLSACKLSFRNLAQTPFVTSLTILAIGIALSLPLGLHALLKNIDNVATHFDYQGSLTIYIKEGTPHAEILALQNQISQKYPAIQSTQYISADQALSEFRQHVDIENIINLLPDNPLTNMLVIQLEASSTSLEQAKIMKTELSSVTWVKMVDLDYEWVEKLNAFLHLGHVLSNCLGLLIGLGVIFIIGNIIRLALEKHRNECEVLNLIGATKAFIRRPFLYRGLIYGVIGAIIAAMTISLATLIMKKPAQMLSELYGGVFAIKPLSLLEIFALCFYSALLGWLGAMLAFYQQQKSLP